MPTSQRRAQLAGDPKVAVGASIDRRLLGRGETGERDGDGDVEHFAGEE